MENEVEEEKQPSIDEDKNTEIDTNDIQNMAIDEGTKSDQPLP